jgi:DNA-binding MarR family transcriptional regulator
VTGTTASPIDRHEVVDGLERLIQLLRVLSPAGEISLTTASTLNRLATGGPRRLSDLAACEGVTQPAMTQLVSRLERQGLAERRDYADDRRVVMVHITQTGRELIERRRVHRATALAALLDELPAEDEQLIGAALPALRRLTDLGAPPQARGR